MPRPRSLIRVALVAALVLIAGACGGSSSESEPSESEQAALDAFESANAPTTTTTTTTTTTRPIEDDPNDICGGASAEAANGFGFCDLRDQLRSGEITPRYPEYCQSALEVPRLVYDPFAALDPVEVELARVYFAGLIPITPEPLAERTGRLSSTTIELAALLDRLASGELTQPEFEAELAGFADMQTVLTEWIAYSAIACSAGTITAADAELPPLPGITD